MRTAQPGAPGAIASATGNHLSQAGYTDARTAHVIGVRPLPTPGVTSIGDTRTMQQREPGEIRSGHVS